jgi:hypothetical protein
MVVRKSMPVIDSIPATTEAALATFGAMPLKPVPVRIPALKAQEDVRLSSAVVGEMLNESGNLERYKSPNKVMRP